MFLWFSVHTLSTYHDIMQLLPFLAHCLEYTRCSFNVGLMSDSMR